MGDPRQLNGSKMVIDRGEERRENLRNEQTQTENNPSNNRLFEAVASPQRRVLLRDSGAGERRFAFGDLGGDASC